MTLDDFIAGSLTQIMAGIRKAQALDSSTDNGVVNPKRAKASRNGGFHQEITMHKVEFDVAVTVTATSEIGAGGGITIAGLHVGAKAKSGDESSTVSRIKFDVPVSLPVGARLNFEL